MTLMYGLGRRITGYRLPGLDSNLLSWNGTKELKAIAEVN
jgi:hypothetical protein